MNPSRSENLEIRSLDSPRGARVLQLRGPLTIVTLFDFQDACRAGEAKATILDITDVPYMDSAGLGSVIGVFTSCQRKNFGFAVMGLSERIRTLFEVTHVDGLLACFDSLEAAETAVLK